MTVAGGAIALPRPALRSALGLAERRPGASLKRRRRRENHWYGKGYTDACPVVVEDAVADSPLDAQPITPLQLSEMEQLNAVLSYLAPPPGLEEPCPTLGDDYEGVTGGYSFYRGDM